MKCKVEKTENANEVKLELTIEAQKFEEGIKISKQCNKILEDAEKKITILLEKDGEVKEENFVSEE